MTSSSNQITGSPSSPFKRLRMSSGSVARQEEAYVPFTELAPSVDRVTKVMVCRRWDAANTAGKYISTEFILSDFTPVFSHGQLYVAISRVTDPKGLKILILPTKKQPPKYTRNIVYKEAFNGLPTTTQPSPTY